jgi:Flp pilus assembly pilin Flp
MRNHRRLEKGQGMLEYAFVLVLVAVLLIALVGIYGKAPRQTLADVYCIVKYKSSTPMRAVDNPQPAGSTLNTALGTHSASGSSTWADFKLTYSWMDRNQFLCVSGDLDTNSNLVAYTVYDGN